MQRALLSSSVARRFLLQVLSLSRYVVFFFVLSLGVGMMGVAASGPTRGVREFKKKERKYF